MPKTDKRSKGKEITPSVRKKMLKLHREDKKTYDKILSKLVVEGYDINDGRTVARHIALAEQEERAKRGEFNGPQASHLAEIEELIKRWKDSIKVDPFAIGKDTMASCRNIEEIRLFEGLKIEKGKSKGHQGHLPCRTLWRDYEEWKSKHKGYIGQGKELRKEIREKGEEIMRLKVEDYFYHGPRLTPKFEKPMIKALSPLLLGGKPEPFSFEWQVTATRRGGARELKVLIVNGENVLETTTDANEKEYEDNYQKVFQAVESKATMLRGLFGDLGSLQAKIHRSLDEVLLRRDYILYRCKLCPGQARLVR